MNELMQLFLDFLSVSALIFMFLCFFCLLSVRKFIVKRYEQETDILSTDFFAHHVTFSTYMIGFMSTAIYAGHLMACLWGWRFYSRNMMFRDLESPEDITKHFSENEIYRVKRLGIVGLILTIQVVCYFIFRIIWPEAFGR